MSGRTLVEAVLTHAAAAPDRQALAYRDELVTYGELSRRMEALAAILKDEYGVGPGDRVAVSAVSRPDYVTALLAVQYLGGTVLPLDKTAKAPAVRDICQTAEPKLVLTDVRLEGVDRVTLRELCGRAAQAGDGDLPYDPPDKEAVAEILFTTGTTGRPKGAMLTYDSIEASMENTWYGVGMRRDDRVLLPLPLNHSFGMRVLRAALWGGSEIVLHNGFTFAVEIENAIQTHGCTAIAAVSASMEMLMRQMGDRFPQVMGKLRYIEISAGAIPVDMRKKLLALLPDTHLHNTWGSTETGGALFIDLREHPDKITSAGKPLEGIELKVVDRDGNEVEARDVESAGRLALRGRMQMSGYYGMPELTAETLVDGWLMTNDLVYTDGDGYVYMLGRADDIINVAGEKVSPVEVENAAQEFPQVRECACIGVDDPDGVTGKVPVLYVVPEPGFSEAELAKYLGTRLEKYKRPKRYIPVLALPRNRMQKLDRKALARMWEETGDMPLTNDTVRTLMERRSIRDFTAEPVPRNLLEVILQTGIHAPSGHNMQTWQFTVLRDPGKIRQLKQTAARTAAANKVYFYGFNEPKALILVTNDRRSHFKEVDSACAAENMMLAAQSFGLGSVWINALGPVSDEPEIRALLDSYGIPKQHVVIATLAMGWPKGPGKLLAKKQSVIRWVEDK